MPYKNPVDHAKWAYTADRYNQPFDLDAVAEELGYPLFMKPYDGGAWVGVSRISERRRRCTPPTTQSGERLMHLQQSVEGYDVFARSLTIGPETMVMKFRPELPMHERYAVEHDFLAAERRRRGRDDLPAGQRVLPVGVQLLRVPRPRRRRAPDRLRQRLPGRRAHLPALLLPVGDDGAGALDRVLRGHRPQGRAWTWTPPRYFAVADDPTCLPEKLAAYRRSPTTTSTTTSTASSATTALPHVPTMVAEWVASQDFDDLLRRHGPWHLPGARARPVHRALPRPDRPVETRHDQLTSSACSSGVSSLM